MAKADVTIKTDPAGLDLITEALLNEVKRRSQEYKDGNIQANEKTKHSNKTREFATLYHEITGVML